MIIDPVKQYAQAVTRGRVKTSRLVRLACARHLRDLRSQRRLKIHFDLEAALQAIAFIETFLVLAEGEHADRPFHLRPWQKFIVGCLFGWTLTDGSRRFRRVYIEVAKGNGKTPLGAAMALYCLMADGEQAAEVYAAAAAKSQAEICYRDAKIMAEKSADLAAVLDIGEHNIAHHDTYSFFRPVSAEARTLDGKRVHFALIDELHVHRNSTVLTKMVNGMKGRRQPMVVVTTNSGSDKTSPCGEEHDYLVDVLEGVKRDESRFGFIAGLDACTVHRAEGKTEPQDGCKKCDQWTDERVWIKANPNLNQSVTLRYIRDQVRNAIGIPSSQNDIKRMNFCIWTQQHTRWLSAEDWTSCGANVDFTTLRGRPCYVGLDFADRIDFAAMVLLFPPESVPTYAKEIESDFKVDAQGNKLKESVRLIDLDKLRGHYIALPYFFMAEAKVAELARNDALPYDLWVKKGFIEATPGDAIDFGFIENRLLALDDLYHYKAVGFDPRFGRQFSIKMINDYRMPMVEVGQGMNLLSEPTKELQRLIITKHFQHPRNPLFTAMANNASVREDSHRRIHIEKPAKTKKIDGIVATIIGLCVSITSPDLGSVYDERARAGDGPIVRGL